jgi:hypothetical protein
MKPAALVATIFLAVVCLGHILRLALNIEVTAAGAVVPMWISVLAVAFTGGLAIMLWRERRR